MSRVNVVFETRRRSDGKYECVFRTPDGKESVWEPFDSDAEATEFLMNKVMPKFLGDVVPSLGGKVIEQS